MIKAYLKYLQTSQHDNYMSNIISCLKKRIAAHGVQEILDIGCGYGANTIEVASAINAKKIYGIELGSEASQAAKEKGINILSCDLSSDVWDVDAESFDFIYSNQVIEHLYSVDKFIVNINRCLRTGGYALISTENLSSWHNVFALFLGYQPFSTTNICTKKWSIGNPMSINAHSYDDPLLVHRAVFTFYALREFLTLYGFKIIEEVSSGYYPFPNSIGNLFARLDKRHSVYMAFLIQKN